MNRECVLNNGTRQRHPIKCVGTQNCFGNSSSGIAHERRFEKYRYEPLKSEIVSSPHHPVLSLHTSTYLP